MDATWHSPDTGDLRRFSRSVGMVLLALGGWGVWTHPTGRLVLALPAAGGLLVLVGEVLPRALKRVYAAWMTVASVMGMVMTAVILSITFFTIFTLTGVLLRLARHDPLARAWKPGKAASYWEPHPTPRRGRDEYRRPY